jgi:hypothetical protein
MNKKINQIFLSFLLLAILTAPQASAQTLERHKNGELIKDKGTIYLIQNNRRFGFRTAGEFLSYGYNFDMAVPATGGDYALPYTEDLKARSGTLVLDASDGRTIYLIYGEQARPINNAGMLYFLNFANRKPVTFDVARYPKGDVVGFDLLFQPRPIGTLINNKGTVYLITNQGRAGFATEAIFRSYGYSFDMAMEANDQDMQLPEAPGMKYRDGTIVNDSGTIFLISEGQKFGFKTWVSFASRGYKLSTLVSGSTGGYPEGVAFE